jgi:hypothetical protein
MRAGPARGYGEPAMFWGITDVFFLLAFWIFIIASSASIAAP